jgi:hypothetical protein
LPHGGGLKRPELESYDECRFGDSPTRRPTVSDAALRLLFAKAAPTWRLAKQWYKAADTGE